MDEEDAAGPAPSAAAAATEQGADGAPVVRFTTGNTEIVSGVLRLFRSKPGDATGAVPLDAAPTTLVAILALPSYMAAADFLQFIAPHQPFITSIRVLQCVASLRMDGVGQGDRALTGRRTARAGGWRVPARSR